MILRYVVKFGYGMEGVLFFRQNPLELVKLNPKTPKFMIQSTCTEGSSHLSLLWLSLKTFRVKQTIQDPFKSALKDQSKSAAGRGLIEQGAAKIGIKFSF